MIFTSNVIIFTYTQDVYSLFNTFQVVKNVQPNWTYATFFSSTNEKL